MDVGNLGVLLAESIVELGVLKVIGIKHIAQIVERRWMRGRSLMPRYIDADKLPELFDCEYKKTRCLIEDGAFRLDNLAEGFTEATRVIRFVAKTEDVAPVIHAHWEIADKTNPFLAHGRCSHCGFEQWIYEQWIFDGLRYCPNCGAKMDEGEESHED